jgi:hypothetical protein
MGAVTDFILLRLPFMGGVPVNTEDTTYKNLTPSLFETTRRVTVRIVRLRQPTCEKGGHFQVLV